MKARRVFKSVVLLSCAVLVATAGLAGPIDGRPVRPDFEARQALDDVFSDYRVFDVSLRQIQQGMKAGHLTLRLGDRELVLDVEPGDFLSPDFKWVIETPNGRVTLPPGPISNYAGTLRGDASASVRLSSRSDHLGGYIRSDSEWLFIDPLADFVAGAPKNLVVVYRNGDVRPDPSRVCGSERYSAVGDAILSQVGGRGGDAPEGGFPIAEFSFEVDGDYEDQYGKQGAIDRIKDFAFEVIDIYEAQLQITLQFAYGHIWNSAGSDPYTSNDAEVTLDQFVDYWLNNEPLFDVMHMISGKNFNFGIAGIAYLDAVCCNGFLCPPGAFGISQDLSTRSDRITVMAHEVGHNFSARHSDGCSGVNCNGFGPIMCSFIQSFGSQTFAQCSVNSIDNWVANNGSCLD